MRSFSLDPAHLMNEVYSYPFPEVRALLQRLVLDQRFMLNTIPATEAAGLLQPFGFEPALELTARADGSLDLDELHLPVQQRLVNALEASLPGIAGFAHRYPVHGSSPAIFNLLAEWQATGHLTSIAVLEGEYEGYTALADALRIPIERHVSLDAATPVDGQVWFVSNPSARDGNWHDADLWAAFLATGCRVVVDAAYVGLTADDHQVALDAPNIEAVLTSPSKIFGVFRHRYTGTTFTREPVASMYGTKWFKDVPALLDTLALYESFPAPTMATRYKPWQLDICSHVAEHFGVEVTPSDVILLSTAADAGDDARLGPYRRGAVTRFGLTKLFEDYERHL